jgi:hypothetical protein
MNLPQFIQTGLITAATLLPFTMALVTLYGKFGATGKLQLALALVTGLLLGGFVMYVQVLPKDLVSWTQVGLVGLIEGLGATGVYEVVKTATAKGAEEAQK